ncbi:ABC transporter permease subunit [Alicyclobacillus macrosporangiidus]|uniref:ABC transporter permease subunit n=1 Tax=Alicyclobacillus macrosporangiidus TaxID=392015 RepID=UPI0004980915|nr:ABC transporter permease subunit [Alicyclobacillus macrosporangiidus]
MSATLYRTSIKMHAQTLLSFALGTAAYLWLFIWAYPFLAKSSTLNNLLKDLPQGLLQMIGYQAGVLQMNDYLAGEFYTLVYIVILSIYVVTTSTRLMAHPIDRGWMSCLLSTPVSRVQVTLTQAAVLVSGIVLVAALTTVAGILGVHWLAPNAPFDVRRFVEMNVVAALLFLTVGGYGFALSCVCPDERTTAGSSAALTVVFFATKTVSALDDHVSWLKYLSLFTAFDPQRITHGQAHLAVVCPALVVASALLFAFGVLAFKRRQMAL